MNHIFKREEKKYILQADDVEKITDLLKKTIKYSVFNSDGIPTLIRTTYLESDNHYIYHLKKSGKRRRFKIRIREYAEDNNFGEFAWIELKEKVDGEGYKNRFLINKKDVTRFIDGKNIINEITPLNKNIDPDYLKLIYKTIQKLIKKNSLYPQLVVQYKRVAFDNGLKGGVRFTFDRELLCNKIDKNDLFMGLKNPIEYSEKNIIMEIKTSGTHPHIINDVVKDHGVFRRRFSKFIFGMEGNSFIFKEAPESIKTIYTPIFSI